MGAELTKQSPLLDMITLPDRLNSISNNISAIEDIADNTQTLCSLISGEIAVCERIQNKEASTLDSSLAVIGERIDRLRYQMEKLHDHLKNYINP